MTEWNLPDSFLFEGESVRFGSMGDGPPLVLLHGTPFSSYEWHRIAPLLARHRSVYFYDMPGYGQSEMRDGQDVSLGRQNRLFAALLQHWGVTKPDVIAHDFGGATALRAHFLNDCDYRSLTLIDPVAIRPWGSPFVQHVRQHEAAFAGMPGYAHEALLPAYIGSSVYQTLPDARLAPYIAPWLGETGQKAFYRQIAQMDLRYTDEVQDRYGALRCPVQVLWGEEDQWIPLEKGRELAELLPNARFLQVPNSGHLMQEDAPEAIIAAALEFLPGCER
ncbi:alpha/beta fold hydrolase [Denitrobaculum tricleocarpae]|uniref:Alpha/beta hydrolase n=1 Tax=Denitrobaculum tricleocarpae TaxID=2591009 RepID=A0A545TUL3_9PROT|nr:alpha/beta hydrolase [Denitrobaculum tricleocarpae]TQV80907.1 alpha/beta hydrolase [Denitrobaculum tricleocarpae]